MLTYSRYKFTRFWAVYDADRFPEAAAKPVGERFSNGAYPSPARRLPMFGSARAASISTLSRSTISGGVRAGAPSPNHALAS